MYEPDDIGMDFVMLHVLEDGSTVVIINFQTYGSLPGRKLPRIDRLSERLRHLRANGTFDIEVNGSEARVSCGPDVRRIAREWNIEIPPAVDGEV